MKILPTYGVVLATLATTASAQQFDNTIVDLSAIDSDVSTERLADVDGDGFLDYVASLADTGFAVARGLGPDAFDAPIVQAITASGPWALADIDGNGASELISVPDSSPSFAPPGGEQVVTYRFVAGLFEEVESVDLPHAVRGLAVGSLNNDAFDDVVVVNSPTGRIHTFYGALSGLLQAGPELVCAPSSDALALGDVDGNGLADIVAAAAIKPELFGDVQPIELSLLLQVERGVFEAEISALELTGTSVDVAVGEVNGDGPADVLVLGDSSLTILLGPIRDLPMTAGGSVSLGTSGTLVLGDLDDDGSSEVLVNAGTSAALVDWRDGLEVIMSQLGPAFGDVDQDGFTDVLGHVKTGLSILHGTGALGWRERAAVALGTQNFEVADVDGDGRSDLLTASSDGVYFARGGVAGAFETASLLEGLPATQLLAVTDQDGDGALDLITHDSSVSPGSLNAIFGDGRGGFSLAKTTPTIPQGFVATGDFNGDDIEDVIMRDATELHVLAGDALGAFSIVSTYVLTNSPSVASSPFVRYVRVADVNGDGADDIAFHLDVKVFGPGDIFETRVVLGASGGVLTDAAVIEDGRLNDLADVTNDGVVDVVMALPAPTFTPAGIAIHRGVGDGTFGAQTLVEIGDEVRQVAVADLNNDGLADLVVEESTFGSSRLTPAFGQPGGGFEKGEATPAPKSDITTLAGEPVRFGDVDNDGSLEVFVFTGETLAIFSLGDTWTRVGNSLAGSNGFSTVRADGPLTPGSTVTIEVPNGPARTSYGLVFGADAIDAPLLGGVLTPSPDAILFGTTDADGRALVSFPWPSDVPAGFEVYIQAWLPSDSASTISIRGVTPAD